MAEARASQGPGPSRLPLRRAAPSRPGFRPVGLGAVCAPGGLCSSSKIPAALKCGRRGSQTVQAVCGPEGNATNIALVRSQTLYRAPYTRGPLGPVHALCGETEAPSLSQLPKVTHGESWNLNPNCLT